MAAYYIMTNYGPMSIQGLKRISDDKINEILKDAPKDMDTFLEVYEKYAELVDNVKKIDLSTKQDILTSAQLAVINGNWQPAGNYLTKHQSLAEYAKKSELYNDSEVRSLINTKQDKGDYALKQDIPTLDGYATEIWVENKNYLTKHQDISGKQDIITDLETIREGAAKGATALQNHQSLEAYAKKSELPKEYDDSELRTLISNKQDIITDLETIRSKSNTAIQPSDISDMETRTHADDTYQVKGNYSTNEEVAAIKRSLEEVIYKNEVYGVSHKYTLASPILERIGNLNNHKELPVQSLMKRCLLTDSGEVTYLDPQDSTKLITGENAILDGTSGQVMVEIPEHYRKFTLTEDSYNCEISLYPFAGAHKVNKCYISAYEASLDRTNNKLSSVVNNTTQFRGGTNQSAWDDTYRSLLGRPVTGVSLTNFRKYANNRGSNWKCQEWDIYCTVFWLYTVEYANLNCQSAFNENTTDEGYKQGGLGSGVTNISDWNGYNSYNPFVPCGHTNSLGNYTGVITYPTPNEDGTIRSNVPIPSYRGIENPFGHILKWTDGVLAKGIGTIQEYYKTNKRSGYSSTLTDDYIKVGESPTNNGYKKEILRNYQGDIMTSVIGGSNTTYFCDYHYQVVSNGAIYGFRSGGGANNGARAGFGSLSSYSGPATARADVGSRICYCEKSSIIE